jgi:hypothetical protein
MLGLKKGSFWAMLELNDATKDVVAEFANPSQALTLHTNDERTVTLMLDGTCNDVHLSPVTH